MPKRVSGGTISDEAAVVLAKLAEEMPRNQVVSLALEELPHSPRYTLVVKQNTVLNGWFSNWLNNNRIKVRVALSNIGDKLPWQGWVAAGAIGMLWVGLVLLAGF